MSEKSGRNACKLGGAAAEAAEPPEAGVLETPAPTEEPINGLIVIKSLR